MKTIVALSVSALVVGLLGCGQGVQTAEPATESRVETPPAEPVLDTTAEAANAEPRQAAEPEPDVPEPEPSQPEALPELWDFSAEWCPPCRDQKPIIHELEGELKGRVEVKIIDVDQEKDLASRFAINAIPTQVFLDGAGNELSRHVGFFPKDSIMNRLTAHGFID